MPPRHRLTLSCLLLLVLASLPGAAEERPRVRSLRILVLSTMLADEGIGEWGFAALVEVDGERILFDTGARPRTVLENARELKVDLAPARELVLSHNHGDHTGGLLTLRRELAPAHPKSLSLAHVGRGIFWSRPAAEGAPERNHALLIRAEYEKGGGRFAEHDGPSRSGLGSGSRVRCRACTRSGTGATWEG